MQPNIVYVLNDRWPTIKAYGLQVAKTCEAFRGEGAQLTLVVPWRKTHSEIRGKSIAELYGVHQPFSIRYLPSLDMTAMHIQSKVLFALQQGLFALCAFVYGALSRGVLYTRDLFTVRALHILGRPLFWEAHRISPRMTAPEVQALAKRTAGVIAITHGVAQALIKLGYPRQRIHVAPDGFDAREFEQLPTHQAAQQALGWDAQQRWIVYVGHLFEHKGVDVLVDAAQQIGDARVVIVGGTQQDQDRLRARDSGHKITWIPFVQHNQALMYMRAADVLVLPNRRDGGQSEYFTSPMKRFEYMASGTPLVASNLPSLREVLSETNAFLVEPDSASALAAGIREVLSRPEQAQSRALQAHHDVAKYSWHQRAQGIIKFISSSSHEIHS